MDDQACVSRQQLYNLEHGIGCVQCGMEPARMTEKGHRVCDHQACQAFIARAEGKLGLVDLFLHELSGVKLRELN